MRIAAPAKLNLFLHVTGKRANGYHELESLTLFTEFADVLDIMPARDISLTIHNHATTQLMADNDNLVIKAARSLEAFTGKGQGAHIALSKYIPVGAGLGGGSADAAATLRGLADFWQVPVMKKILMELGASLGSDIPACLLNQPGWMTGTGDIMQPVALPQGGFVVLVNPCQPLLTADVFRALQPPYSKSVPQPEGWDSLEGLCQWANQQRNDLEAPAVALMPAIADILAALRATPALLARMSGSGATCFGIYDSQITATQAAQTIKAAHPAWWVQATPIKGADHG
ncbi:MAG: 4-(cytidine 5'-diphospho)-2-C-methyl-D-erythritol kinase, partial [Rickettsiales bacterium]|nr:4-(cytidine 5'-diphospho)-2-C-methyl-D-erythritol kinase [Rickettsiales bacterium]